ncbi:hypothetical protein KUL42_13390 [Alteromonas sp. KUL42]|uniref:class I SAM-dependent methyltransferase n=1 Tax=Alteromonas sp. KUL42 TaxID=2480797 RepID=UPI0010FFB758|nr:class I SAM-dependent methyltransferase [Alteromonas sp. KUL42]GEA06578.1 hypothetical protein KUL42_13390 [Alteromonas sp. KUL42]
MSAYKEPQKNKARELVINSAVKSLTKARKASTLTRKSYLREVRDHLVSSGHSYDASVAKQLTDATITRWEAFYDSVVQDRSPANLKVAYLSGPNPENDLRVLCKAGVLPENIWAFESENTIYSEAVISALSSEFPFIKIINGGLDTFLEASPQKFDIIYLDFCGPLPSRNKKQKTLGALTRIFSRHALNSPGALITNFSLPNEEQDSEGRNLLAKLVACYLYPKSSLEDKDTGSGFAEGPIAEDLCPEEWLVKVESDLEFYYGQFITRLLIDHASLISTYNRFPKNNYLYKKFFSGKEAELLAELRSKFFHFDERGDGGDVIIDASQYPTLWSMAALDKTLNARDANYPQFIFNDENFSKFADQFLAQLDTATNKKALIDNHLLLTYLLLEGNEQPHHWSAAIQKLSKSHRFSDFYQFCDLVLFHQVLETLFRQVAVPYHINVEKTERWVYQAKDTPMFMDMLLLDECRYLYDWMPTMDMFNNAVSDTERQLSYRFILDGVGKHRRWYNPEYFFGTAVVDQWTKNFEAKTLSSRKKI